MNRTLEVIKIAGIPVFNREKVTQNSPEENEIICLQKEVGYMVREVKAHDGDKKELANKMTANLVSIYGSHFNNIEQSIKELAKAMWN